MSIDSRHSVLAVAAGLFVLGLIGAGPVRAADPLPKTVAEVYTDKGALKGKQVKVHGKVVKFNSGILGKNFLHIQDGSGKDGTNDLTITTQDQVKVGDQITAVGTVVTDKNLGSGYSYSVLIEEAKVKVE